MKKLIFLSLSILLTITAYGQEKATQDFKKLNWLSGNWVRTNSKPGQTGLENWKIVSPSKLTGKGITLKGTDTVFVENLELIIKEKDILYVVRLKSDPRPVYFKLTSISNDGFVCENPENDFPKKIAYSLKNGTVTATISGGNRNVDFIFVKKAKP